jgi:hypothetical protein
MFVKDIESQESLIHVCKGKTLKDMSKKNLEIRLHDIHIFSWIYNDGDAHQEYIKFCPYCGVDLEKDAFENEE